MNAPMDRQELIFEYATGSLAEGPALVAASYLAMNEDALDDYSDMEAVGGALFDELAPTPMADDALDQVMARLDAEGSAPIMLPRRYDASTEEVLPHPLKHYVPKNIGDLEWSSVGPGVEQCELGLASSGYKAALLRIKPGRAMPKHTHKGIEYTLVLSGGYSDASGRYGEGDISICDGQVDHQPVADEEGCMCLIVMDAPIHMTGPLGRILNFFIRF